MILLVDGASKGFWCLWSRPWRTEVCKGCQGLIPSSLQTLNKKDWKPRFRSELFGNKSRMERLTFRWVRPPWSCHFFSYFRLVHEVHTSDPRKGGTPHLGELWIWSIHTVDSQYRARMWLGGDTAARVMATSPFAALKHLLLLKNSNSLLILCFWFHFMLLHFG